MTFRARLRRGHPTWTAWRQRHAAGGLVAAVAFHWCMGDDYATGDLSAEEVNRLHGNADVQLECFGATTETVFMHGDPDVVGTIEWRGTAPPTALRHGTPEWRAREAARVREWRKRRNGRAAGDIG